MFPCLLYIFFFQINLKQTMPCLLNFSVLHKNLKCNSVKLKLTGSPPNTNRMSPLSVFRATESRGIRDQR